MNNLKSLKWLTILLALVSSSVYAGPNIGICTGEYALCAASSATPTGKMISVNGRKFKEGMAVCPILTGKSVANLDLMKGSCNAPSGKVWSLFGMPPESSYPQAPTWTVVPAVFRTFTIGDTSTTGMSNMWSFSCDIQVQAQSTKGPKLASCYGPIMESPFTGKHVKPGELGFTQAPEGATWPVGGNAPQPKK